MRVFVSRGVLEKILDGLVENARRAMADSHRRRLTLVLSRQGANCLLDASDTGCGLGLPAGEWDLIFERHYTTKSAIAGQAAGGLAPSPSPAPALARYARQYPRHRHASG